MNLTRLVFKNISDIVGSDMCIIVLTDKTEERQISIVCDDHTRYQFALRMSGAPVVNKLLPEVLLRFMHPEDDGLRVIIHSVTDGQYNAVLCNENTNQSASIRISDAVLLSFISDVPLYVENELYRRQSVPYCSGRQGLSIPINTISNAMLQDALDKAIQSENYELASQIRNEQQRRQQSNQSSQTEIQ
ncbi:MAG: bifunctional nuclease domain-containing protein [Prevotella sp.]